MNKPRMLADFEGLWAVERKIRPKDGPGATFVGTARWSPRGEGLIYHETGQMVLTGHPPMQAERKYFWAPDLKVYFEDGRFFHRVPPMGGRTDHWCDPDTYNVLYTFDDWPQFNVVWEVTGPRKDYSSHSQYMRK